MEHQRYPLVEAIEIVTGQRIHIAVAVRWCTKGLRGCYLQSWHSNKGRVTTMQAVRDFLSATG